MGNKLFACDAAVDLVNILARLVGPDVKQLKCFLPNLSIKKSPPVSLILSILSS